MKLIHLSDLHLGVRVNEFSMIDEQKYILQQILQIIDWEEPDGVLVAGDVYDKAVPSAEAVGLFDSFLSALAEREMSVFVISGNHDSPERIAFGASIMGRGGVHLSPVYHGHVEPILLTGKDGISAQIYMLPFVKPAHVRPYFPEREITDYTDAVRAAVEEMTGSTATEEAGPEGAGAEGTGTEGVETEGTKMPDAAGKSWKILMAHQFVTGAEEKGEDTSKEETGENIEETITEEVGENGGDASPVCVSDTANTDASRDHADNTENADASRIYVDNTESADASRIYVDNTGNADASRIYVGNTENVDASVFAPFDYVALGHIHRAYNVGNGRYCGTPLKYSFSEVNQEKSVTILELGERGENREVTKSKKNTENTKNTAADADTDTDTGIRIRTVPLHPLHDWRKIRGSYLEVSSRKFYEQFDRNAYMHVTLTDEEDVPDAAARLMVIYPNLMKLKYDNCRTRSSRIIEGVGEPESRDPLTIFGEFYEKQNNRPMQTEQAQYMQKLIEDIWKE